MPMIMPDRMTAFVEAMVMAGGSTAGEARQVAEHLVDANLAGHDSHGVGMMPTYVNALQFGKLAADQQVSVIRDDGVFLQLDGNAGYGQSVGVQAMDMAIAKAEDHGCCILSLRNSHHLGRIGAWAEMAARKGLIAVHWVNAITRFPLVAPFGGSDARFTTNPYCTAVPATPERPMLVLDMATTKVALGKVRVAYNKGVPVPEGSLIDHEGRATTDPAAMYEEPQGAMMSMGEHKGYGLALICEILAGALSGGGTFQPDRADGFSIINNMMAVLIDPARLGDSGALGTEIDLMQNYVTASPPAPGVDQVMVPGDPERKARAERLENGLPVDDTTCEEMIAAAVQVGMSEANARQMMFG